MMRTNYLNVKVSQKHAQCLLYKPAYLQVSFRYLQYEHYRYCVPSNVSSGLASLPLVHVWYDGKENTSWPTNPELSNGDRLNGSEAYAMILPYFTTNDMTPMDVHRLGWEQLKMLYPLVCT